MERYSIKIEARIDETNKREALTKLSEALDKYVSEAGNYILDDEYNDIHTTRKSANYIFSLNIKKEIK